MLSFCTKPWPALACRPVSALLEALNILRLGPQNNQAISLKIPGQMPGFQAEPGRETTSRVRSISLTVTNSLLEKLSAISEPFLELKELALISQDNVALTLPGTIRWGPRFCTLHSTRIGIPSFPQLLLPSHDLVNLRLHEIPRAGYFSPDAFANALSEMTQLRTLSLHFLSLPPRRTYLGLSPHSYL